jgi:hypothetical protein
VSSRRSRAYCLTGIAGEKGAVRRAKGRELSHIHNTVSGARQRRARRRHGTLAVASVAFLAAAAAGLWVTVFKPSAQASTGAGVIENASFATNFAISAPGDGEVTDGGLIFRLAGSQSPGLTGIQLLDHQEPSALHLLSAGVLPLGSGLEQAVGIRPGLPSVLGLEGPVSPLQGWEPGGSASTDYELILGLKIPAGAGPWTVTGVRLAYTLGSAAHSLVLPHELMVCGTADPSCGEFGTAQAAAESPSLLKRTGGCSSETTSWASGKPVQAWLATDVHSPYWEGSGGNITLSTTRAASFTMVSSASYETTITGTVQGTFPFVTATVVATAKSIYGISLTRSVQTTSTWQYTLTVPPDAPTERATVYVYGWVLPVTTETTAANCSASYSYGTVYAPDASTSPGNDYCIAVEPYPGVADLGPSCHSG